MTVDQLRAKLARFEGTLPVVVLGYEAGFTVVSELELESVIWNANVPGPDYYGEHDRPSEYMGTD